ncbi:TWiK family of potassium channels protein 18-like [Harmonia axyridis]|uniref:TWiK family of potassium channels protein 18-like n=1 Tax=Harmonia axyridis TaxID=115357 RepID=UPI001E277704|nr:TWiK family of potassium channels protein 18-like [Harmonia axyridis]
MKNGNGDTSCVDIDHITFERNNYKNKLVEASVQTSPLIPYRLRFWPRSSCDMQYDPKKESCTVVGLQCGCKVVTQWVLSQMGLTLVVFGWALLGAYAFYKTEGPREFGQQEQMEQTQKELSIELATSLRQTEGHNENWPKVIERYMQQHEDVLLKAVAAGFGEGGQEKIWTYPGCILFAVSLLTTLGFGAPVPRTTLGRGTAVIFSAIGIPLHFLLIFNIGNLGAIRLQQLAYRISSTDIPSGSPPPKWLKWFPVGAILLYYLMGVTLFGFLRKREAFDSFLFPLDFTAAGGVSTVPGYIKICYAIYLEVAVTLAALVVSLLQASATSSLVDVGLKLGLLTNT